MLSWRRSDEPRGPRDERGAPMIHNNDPTKCVSSFITRTDGTYSLCLYNPDGKPADPTLAGEAPGPFWKDQLCYSSSEKLTCPGLKLPNLLAAAACPGGDTARRAPCGQRPAPGDERRRRRRPGPKAKAAPATAGPPASPSPPPPPPKPPKPSPPPPPMPRLDDRPRAAVRQRVGSPGVRRRVARLVRQVQCRRGRLQ